MSGVVEERRRGRAEERRMGRAVARFGVLWRGGADDAFWRSGAVERFGSMERRRTSKVKVNVTRQGQSSSRSARRPLGSLSSRSSCRPPCAMLLFSICLI